MSQNTTPKHTTVLSRDSNDDPFSLEVFREYVCDHICTGLLHARFFGSDGLSESGEFGESHDSITWNVADMAPTEDG